jgi:adenylate kinase
VRLLLLGAPGAGKGTQGKRLADACHVTHIATGDIIRDHIARGTEFGKQVEAAIAGGNFAPDADILYWVNRRLGEPDAAQGYILDGFPRDLAQAKAFDAEAIQGNAFDLVLELIVQEERLLDRLSGRLVCPACDRVYHRIFCPPQKPDVCDVDGTLLVQRPDDAPIAVRHRLEVYEQVTLPLRRYYAEQGTLNSVSASGDPESVFEKLFRVVQPFCDGKKSARVGV